MGCPGDGLVTVLEPVDDAAVLEDAAEDDGGEALLPVPQPVVPAPITMVAAAQPATIIRAISMGIPSMSIHASNSVDAYTRSAAVPDATAKCWREQGQRK